MNPADALAIVEKLEHLVCTPSPISLLEWSDRYSSLLRVPSASGIGPVKDPRRGYVYRYIFMLWSTVPPSSSQVTRVGVTVVVLVFLEEVLRRHLQD